MSGGKAGHSPALIRVMAVASGAAVANIYYNQPMLADMARSVGASAHSIGLVATATQIGYAAGMPLFIPLGDLVERRRLVAGLFAAVGWMLVGAAVAPDLGWLIAASFSIGLTTVIAQLLIPLATELAPPAEQGRTIGTMMTGVLLGILLARTVSGFIAQHFGWRSMFFLAAAGAWLFAILLRVVLPEMPPRGQLKYRELLGSLFSLFVKLPQLRQVSFVAAMFLASFSAFWTTLVFLLNTAPYHFGSQVAGLFGLVGAVGAGVAPWAGHLADRRGPRWVVSLAIAGVLGAFVVFLALRAQWWGLVAGVILLDAAVQAAQVANQSRILSLAPQARNRVNTIYMTSYFLGGSFGSLAGAIAWERFGWTGVCATAIACMLLASLALGAGGARAAASEE